jgi:hypothetical protein
MPWVFLFLLLILGMSTAEVELPALSNAVRYVSMVAVLGGQDGDCGTAIGIGENLTLFYLEEPPTEVIIELGLVWIPGARSQPAGTR